MPMPRPKKTTFTAKQPYSRMDNREIVFRGKAVVNAARETSEFSNAPVDLNKLDSDLDSLLQLDTDAMDGSKMVRAARDEMREEVIPHQRAVNRLEFSASGARRPVRPRALPGWAAT